MSGLLKWIFNPSIKCPSYNASIFNRLDYASVGLQQIRNNLQDFKEQVAIRRTNNQKTTMYTATEHVPNSFTKSIPVESYWSAIFAGSLNATGFFSIKSSAVPILWRSSKPIYMLSNQPFSSICFTKSVMQLLQALLKRLGVGRHMVEKIKCIIHQ